MASLCKNGQEYKCPFFKSAGQMLQKALRKTHYEHNAANSDFLIKNVTAHVFNIYYGQNDLTTIGYPIISFRII
jgi:hypothetical protein